jgi:hypothetical protein
MSMASNIHTEGNRALIQPLINSLSNSAEASGHAWFARALAQNRLLAYLEFAPAESVVSSLNSLLYAFTHPGTREGLCQLCVGLFGLQSVVLLDDYPNQVGITITNSNDDFLKAVADQTHAISDGIYAQAGTSLQEVVSSDPQYFFKRFLPAGVVIKSINIS